jgi:hypothetical protein
MAINDSSSVSIGSTQDISSIYALLRVLEALRRWVEKSFLAAMEECFMCAPAAEQREEVVSLSVDFVSCRTWSAEDRVNANKLDCHIAALHSSSRAFSDLHPQLIIRSCYRLATA